MPVAASAWGGPIDVATYPGGTGSTYIDAAPWLNGGFVSAWYDSSSFNAAIRIVRFDAFGRALDATPIELAAISAPVFWDMSVATLPNGNIFVAWTEGAFPNQDVRYAVCDANGAILTASSPLALLTAGLQGTVQLVQTGPSNIMAFWYDGNQNSGDVISRVMNVDGSVLSSTVTVNTNLPGIQSFPALASLAGNGSLFVWKDGTVLSFRTSFGSYSTVLPVVGVGGFFASKPDAAGFADGRFAIAYVGGPFGANDAYVRLFNADRTPATSDLLVNITGDATEVHVATLPDGGFIVTWTNPSNAHFGQVFNSTGGKIGGEFGMGSGNLGDLVTLADGRVVEVWKKNSEEFEAQIYDARANHAAPTSGDDIIAGLTSADMINGGDGHDSIAGAAGDDTLNGGADNDSLYGGNGGDRLLGGIGADSLDGGANDDLLIGDGVVAWTSNAMSVQRLYLACFRRPADDGGQINWTTALDTGTSLASVATGFVASQEFFNLYGSPTNAQYVTLLYQNVLNRAPDTAGFNNWIAQLNSGTSREQVLLGFSESAEFQIATNITSFAGEVFRLYDTAFNRGADVGGFTGWVDARTSGLALSTMVDGFMVSAEFTNLYGSLSNSAFVNQLYLNALNRPADPGGLAFWTDQLNSATQTRAQVLIGFSEGQEHINLMAVGLNGFMDTAAGFHRDVLTGGSGVNSLTGGRGADTFIFNTADNATATVYGFEVFDTLRFEGFGFANPAAALAAMSQQGANVVFASQGDTITFHNTQLATLQAVQASDWVFV